MKAWQRQIREKIASSDGDLFGRWWEGIDTRLETSRVKEIGWDEAAPLILQYEWLGNMGTTEFAYGLFFGSVLGGVVCFGRTAGTGVYASIAGEQHAGKAITLCRGACAHYAHEHSASKLISDACRMMFRDHGKSIFIAYSDPSAGEIGTVYQASGWMYCGMTSATEKFDLGDGKIRDARLVHAYTRDRTGGTLKYKRSRAEQKKLMVENGARFFKGNAKHRYLKIVADKKTRREILRDLLMPTLPYPKRQSSEANAVETTTGAGFDPQMTLHNKLAA